MIFKETNGGAAYALYANSDADRPARVPRRRRPASSGTVGARREPLDAPRGDVRRRDPAPVRERRRRRARCRWTASSHAGDGPLTFGANHVWGEQLPRPHRRGPRLQPRPEPAEISADMGRSVVPGHARAAARSGPGRDRIVRGAAAVADRARCTCRSPRTAAWPRGTASRPRSTPSGIWDPGTGAFVGIPSGRNLFCAGQVTGADGRLLVVRRHIQDAYDGIEGHPRLQPAAGHVGARPGHERRAAGTRRPRRCPTGASSSSPATTSPSQRARHERAAHECVQHAAVRSTTRRTRPGPTCPARPGGCRSTRSCSCCRTASCSTPARTRPRGRFDLNTGQWSVVGQSPIDGQSAVMYRPGQDPEERHLGGSRSSRAGP